MNFVQVPGWRVPTYNTRTYLTLYSPRKASWSSGTTRVQPGRRAFYGACSTDVQDATGPIKEKEKVGFGAGTLVGGVLQPERRRRTPATHTLAPWPISASLLPGQQREQRDLSPPQCAVTAGARW